MAKFRKKPVVVEAERFFPDEEPWPAGVTECVIGGADAGVADDVDDADERAFIITTLEGPLTVRPGNWIITGVEGERYPCRDDIFAVTYDPVPEEREKR